MLSIIITKPYDKCFTFLTKMFLKTPISVILCTQLYMDFGFIQEITISIYIIEEKETWLLGPLRPRVGVHGLGIGSRVFVVKVLQML